MPAFAGMTVSGIPMTKQHVEQLIQTALDNLQQAGKLPEGKPRIQIDQTKDKQHGDFASNIALILAKPAQRKPREVAEMIVQVLPKSPQILKVEIAGPGFINFFLFPKRCIALFQISSLQRTSLVVLLTSVTVSASLLSLFLQILPAHCM